MSSWDGTINVNIGDEGYTLRPSFDALMEFEDLTGVSVIQAHEDFTNGKFSLKIAAAAIWAGIRGHNIYTQNPKLDSAEFSFRVLGEKIRRYGFDKVQLEVIKFLAYAVLPHDKVVELEASDEATEEKKSTV